MDRLPLFCLLRENVIWFSHDIEYCIDKTDSFHFAVLKNIQDPGETVHPQCHLAYIPVTISTYNLEIDTGLFTLQV